MTRPSIAGKVGALWGLVFGAVAGVWIAIANSRPPESNLFGGITVGLVFVVPFMFAAAALRMDAVLRAGIWLGSGIFAVLLSFVSVVTLGLLPAAILLLLGGIRTLPPLGVPRTGLAMGSALGLLMAGAVAFSALMVGRESACWVLERSNGEVWRRIPATTSLTLGPSQLEARCTELISPEASILSLAVWGVSAFSLFGFARRSRTQAATGEVAL